MVATGATQGLARYDVDINGPIGDDWRFNVGGFYRYDHGVRDPGFPGIRGGQFKGNITRLLDNGYVRFSAKVINDRNQFILDLPFENASSPRFVPGFGKYGSMNTNEGLGLSRTDANRERSNFRWRTDCAPTPPGSPPTWDSIWRTTGTFATARR